MIKENEMLILLSMFLDKSSLSSCLSKNIDVV